MTRTALYRHFDENSGLLYVGVTCNPLQRLDIHRSQSSWAERIALVTVEWHETRADAEAAEAHAIRTERPQHNIVAQPRGIAKGTKLGPRAKPDTSFARWLRESGTTAKAVAEIVGVEPVTASRWARGLRFPNVLVAAQIEQISNGAVPASSWTTPTP